MGDTCYIFPKKKKKCFFFFFFFLFMCRKCLWPLLLWKAGIGATMYPTKFLYELDIFHLHFQLSYRVHLKETLHCLGMMCGMFIAQIITS